MAPLLHRAAINSLVWDHHVNKVSIFYINEKILYIKLFIIPKLLLSYNTATAMTMQLLENGPSIKHM